LWLIAGLGNPGSRYARTRHNTGFLVVEELASRARLEFKEKTDYRFCSGSIEGEKIVLLEPLTFMNRSGSAVKRVMDKYSVPPEKIIVIYDDLDLETGKMKVRKKGSSGGHKGVESIIQSIGTNVFIRVKIGIGRDPFVPVEDFVLSKFRKGEIPLIREAVAGAADAVESIMTEGVDKAMNRYN
jgi:PTH1 family peptidyl-tRNA hydrolase